MGQWGIIMVSVFAAESYIHICNFGEISFVGWKHIEV